jgi:hypothetical protein
MDNTFADTAIVDNTITDSSIAASYIMHEMLNEVSIIMSISQLALLNHDGQMSPKLQTEMERIIQTARNLSERVQNLADVLDEED